jgi:phosphatidylglycerol:prolipoprotein diacylglycerol transferase
MLPQILHIGPITVYSYGVLNALGFLLAVLWPTHLAKKEGIPPAKMEGLGLVILFTAGIGSKLLTAWDYPGFYSGGWNHFLLGQIVGRAGVFYGGFLFAVAGSALYCRLAHLPFSQAADCVAPGLALAQGLGRIGCFLAGCCWGTTTHLPFGVTFNSELAHTITGVPLHVKVHPTQLYEAGVVLLSIPFLMSLRKTKSFQGEVMLAYVLYYAIARFFLEFVRGDLRGYFFGGLLSTSQLISLLIVPAAVFLLVRRKAGPERSRGTACRTLVSQARWQNNERTASRTPTRRSLQSVHSNLPKEENYGKQKENFSSCPVSAGPRRDVRPSARSAAETTRHQQRGGKRPDCI